MREYKPEFLYLITTGWKSGQPHEIEIWYVEHDSCYYLCAEHRDGARIHQPHRSAGRRMAPAGFPGFKGNINQEIEITLTEPGIYGVKCSPHYAMGMVMLIAVGGADPAAAAIPEAVPKRARDRLAEILARPPQPQE